MNITTHTISTPKGSILAQQWQPAQCVSAVPLVLLHDSLGCIGTWKTFPSELAQHIQRPVIAYDRLGFGQSSALLDPPPLDFIRRSAQEEFTWVKQSLQLSAYHLLGYSVGGCIAIERAAIDAECASVITMAAQAFVENKTLAGLRRAQVFFSAAENRQRLVRWHDEKVDWVLSAWLDTWLSEVYRDWTLDEAMPKVQCPVLAIHGEDDEYGSRVFPERIVAQVASADASMQLIPDCGHAPHQEQSSVVLEAISAFLRQQP